MIAHRNACDAFADRFDLKFIPSQCIIWVDVELSRSRCLHPHGPEWQGKVPAAIRNKYQSTATEHMDYLWIFATTSVFIGVTDAWRCVIILRQLHGLLYLPVWRIWMRTSWACGGATSTSSILRDSPAPQQTAALHFITFPAVSDILQECRRSEFDSEKMRSEVQPQPFMTLLKIR